MNEIKNPNLPANAVACRDLAPDMRVYRAYDPFQRVRTVERVVWHGPYNGRVYYKDGFSHGITAAGTLRLA